MLDQERDHSKTLGTINVLGIDALRMFPGNYPRKYSLIYISSGNVPKIQSKFSPSTVQWYVQGFVKEEVFCFRYPYFYFWHEEITSTASQQTSTASQLNKDLNKVPLLLQNLGWSTDISKPIRSIMQES